MALAPYLKQKKNLIAVNTLRSWCRACRIFCRPSDRAGCDLTVLRDDSVEMEVAIVLGEVPPEVPPDCMVISARLLTCTRVPADEASKPEAERRSPRQIALQEFHRVTEAAGFGTPNPLNRGVEPEHKLHYRDEEFLVAVRHREFRRSPNPADASIWARYKISIEKTSWAFLRVNYELCRRHIQDIDDLLQMARSWVTIFAARYECIGEVRDDSARKCTSWLQQRFGEYRRILLKKERSMLADADTVSIALIGRPYSRQGIYDGEKREDSPRAGETPAHFYIDDPRACSPDVDPRGEVIDEPRETEEEYARRHQILLDTSSPRARRQSAARMLSVGLALMPHEDLVENLERCCRSTLIDPEAQREAQRQLAQHVAVCKETECHAAVDRLAAVGIELLVQEPLPQNVVKIFDGPLPPNVLVLRKLGEQKPVAGSAATGEKTCPKCKKTGPVATMFGTRRMKRVRGDGQEVTEERAQSHCRTCRSGGSAKQPRTVGGEVHEDSPRVDAGRPAEQV